MSRVLLLGPVVESSTVGGLHLALSNVVAELRMRGWDVTAPIYSSDDTDLSVTVVPPPPLLGTLQSSRMLLRVREMIPLAIRKTVSALFWPKEAYEAAARNLRWVAAQLSSESRYDVVLVCPDANVPGMLSLALSLHPRIVVISLSGLAEELQPHLWWALRRKAVHPYFFHAAKPVQVRCAVFASQRWKDEAVRAGLAETAAHTIYFGVPVRAPLPRPKQSGRRLLWVGRLAPEKGLHTLLEALPMLRAEFPDLKLTAVAGQGEAAYRAQIEKIIEARQLEGIVNVLPPVAREELPAYYASHDVLFFHSMFQEPVALVLMEAFAAGIPVVANRVINSELVRDGETCVTYDPTDRKSLSEALEKLLADPSLGERLAAKARALVEARYSLTAMGNAYDQLLREQLT